MYSLAFSSLCIARRAYLSIAVMRNTVIVLFSQFDIVGCVMFVVSSKGGENDVVL